MSPPATALFTRVLALAAWQHDQFRPSRLGDSIQLALAQMCFKEFHVGAFYADHGEARLSLSLAHIAALTHKNLGHPSTPFPGFVLGIYP
jgi:hypothetical protein